MKLQGIEIYESYIGKGAPSNASGSRRGYGLNEQAAHDGAGHWANQAPWAAVHRALTQVRGDR